MKTNIFLKAGLILWMWSAADCISAGAQPVDDSAINAKLVSFAKQLMDDGEHTPASDLIDQLKRKHYPLQLASPSRRTRKFQNVAERIRPAVVCVGGLYKCDKCEEWHCGTASGFFIHQDGILATCYHVVNESRNETMIVMTADGTLARVVEVLAANKFADVAILKVEGTDYPFVRLKAEAPVGASVGVWSHPDGHFFSLSQGIVSRRFLKHTHGGPRPEMFSITADFAQGSSGGAVFDLQGNVVGVAAATVSLYHQSNDNKTRHPQMVLKNCVSAADILRLVEKPKD